MLIQAAVVTSALALWIWVLTECAHIVTKRRAIIAAPLILIAGLVLTYHLQRTNPVPPRLPVTCKGDGVDFDTRDGLCYTQVPKRFQRY
jgi:hypothetical protein